MGTPKRYEELSRVIDTLDRFVSADADRKFGTLRGQKVGIEPAIHDQDDPVIFFRFRRFIWKNDRETLFEGDYRLYESYWSPAAAGAASATGVMIWLLWRALHPLSVLTKPWRAHQRLKRTYLYRMFYDRGAMPVMRYRQLALAYRNFEGMDARRRYPAGLFSQFEAYIADILQRNPRACRDVLDLANRWKWQLVRAQAGVLALALTAFASLVGLAAGTVYLVAFALGALGLDHPLITTLVQRAGTIPIWINTVSTIVLLGGAVALGRFLQLYLSDVVFWTTTLEKDVRYQKRREILKGAEETLCHVLADPRCERIVILGHSLGTAIAYQTLLNLGKRLSSERQSGRQQPSRYDALRKISHFISLGSPIDRINYFFHLTFSRYHRYNRVSDDLMGSTSDLPFSDGKKRAIQWINVRDRADPIASRLFSPRGHLPNRDEIQEVEVSSSHFPSPGRAHTGYFESTLAAKILFDASILGRTSLQLQSNRPRWSKAVAMVLRFFLWGVAAILAWSVAIGGWGYILGTAATMRLAQSVGFAAVALIGISWLLGRIFDAAHHLTVRS